MSLERLELEATPREIVSKKPLNDKRGQHNNKRAYLSGNKHKDSVFALHVSAEQLGISKATMSFYGSVIGPKLTAILEQLREENLGCDIQQEVDHARAIHREKLQLFNIAMENPMKVEGDAYATMFSVAAEMLQQSIDNVTRILERQAKINALQADKLSPYAIDGVVKQISLFVYRCFDAEIPDKTLYTDEANYEWAMYIYQCKKQDMAKFNQLMTDHLQLPSMKNLGTSITPDQQVLAMDESIPSAPE